MERFTSQGKRDKRGDQLVLGFASRLIPQKNLHRFLEILGEVRARLHTHEVVGLVAGAYVQPYPVLDYGSDSYAEYIASLVRHLHLEGAVRFVGEVEPAHLPKFYHEIDILVHPTTNVEESFGCVPVQAMAAGVPVVAAAYGGLKDTILHGRTGFLMATWTTDGGIRMDIQSGVEAVITLLKNPQLRTAMGHQATVVAQQYSTHCFRKLLNRAIASCIPGLGRQSDPVPVGCMGLRVAPSRSETFLPQTHPDWPECRAVIDYYTSMRAFCLNNLTLLRPSAPVVRLSGGYVRHDDPAWPSISHLTPRDWEILSEAACPRRRAAIQATDMELIRLARMGLLLFSNDVGGDVSRQDYSD